MKTLKKTCTAVAVAALMTVTSVTAIDFQTNYSSDDVQFKKELIYILSKTEDLMRTFRKDGLTESLKSAVLDDEDMRYVIEHESRYADLWAAIAADAEPAESDREAADEL